MDVDAVHRFKDAPMPMEVDEDGPPSHLVDIIAKHKTPAVPPRIGLSKSKVAAPPPFQLAAREPAEGRLLDAGDDSCIVAILQVLRDCRRLRTHLNDRSVDILRKAKAGAPEELVIARVMQLVFSRRDMTVDGLRAVLPTVVHAFSEWMGELDTLEVREPSRI